MHCSLTWRKLLQSARHDSDSTHFCHKTVSVHMGLWPRLMRSLEHPTWMQTWSTAELFSWSSEIQVKWCKPKMKVVKVFSHLHLFVLILHLCFRIFQALWKSSGSNRQWLPGMFLALLALCWWRRVVFRVHPGIYCFILCWSVLRFHL